MGSRGKVREKQVKIKQNNIEEPERFHDGFKPFYVGGIIDQNRRGGFYFYSPDFAHFDNGVEKKLFVYYESTPFFKELNSIFGENIWRSSFEKWFMLNYPQYEVNEFDYQQ